MASRRDFLKIGGSGAAGLVIAFSLPESVPWPVPIDDSPFAPNAFVRISRDDAVTIVVNKSEMGQAVQTSLAMLVAEELECDWDRIRVEAAPVTPVYNDPTTGEYLTAGSTSIVSSWTPFRIAGATARLLLVEAAAKRWRVGAQELRAERGRVYHDASERSASFGELAAVGATLAPPTDVPLKTQKHFRVIGTNRLRLDARDKVTGAATYSIDVTLPDLLTAVVAHAPVCGGTVKRVDAEQTLAIPGVVKVKRIATGVAVIARDFWSACRGRDALAVHWDTSVNGALSTDALRVEYRDLAEKPGRIAEDVGDLRKAIMHARRTIEAVYEVPFLAHAPMEPLNAVAHVKTDECEIWAGTEYQTMDQRVASQITGLRPERVRIHTTLLGGAFGRRATPTSDFVAEAVEVAKGEGVPIKTIWTREDDIQGGYFRPMFVHKVRAAIDESGRPVAWHQCLVGESVGEGTVLEPLMLKDGIDISSVMGAFLPYAIENRRIEVHNARKRVSVLWWRSVGHSHTAFVDECFLDEIAAAGGRDPLELRRELLRGQMRHLQVLDLAADKAGWGTTPPPGRARGVAIRESFGTYVAQIAEVSIESGGEVRVHRVVCAVDCGIAVNPNHVVAQIESGIVYGLSAALYGAITIANGRAQQRNFNDYRVLKMDRMPEIEVHLVRSDAAPSGAGEPGLPPIAPAVANAIFALTGTRIRSLPIHLR